MVTEDEIAEIVAAWTGIPVSRLQEGERAKLLRLDEILHERVVGQDEAVQLVADAIIRPAPASRTHAADRVVHLPRPDRGREDRAGPGTRGGAVRLVGQHRAPGHERVPGRHTVSRLVGAPPGYVGYEEGGQLTEAVRRRPYSVVLFDKIEKAHPDVFNTLLQVLDNGHITDAQGHTVDFRNTVIIMTSNVGAEHLLVGGTDEDRSRPTCGTGSWPSSAPTSGPSS